VCLKRELITWHRKPTATHCNLLNGTGNSPPHTAIN
jgi:hypothetical protein